MKAVTNAQMNVINEVNRLDSAYRERLELKQGLNEIKVAIRQVLAKEITSREDLIQLEEALPGITKIYAQAMGFSVAEFGQQLRQGIILKPSLRAGLEALLNDPLMFP